MRSKLLIVSALSIGSVYGCSCKEPTVQQAKSGAEVVFRGTIIAMRDADPNAKVPTYGAKDTKKIEVFRVERVWQGQVGQVFEMRALEETSMCIGFIPSHLRIGNDLLVYASRVSNGPDYYTNTCTRTALAKNTKDFDELGPGKEPSPNSN